MPEIQIPIQPVENPILCFPYREPDQHWLYVTKTGIPSKHAGCRGHAGLGADPKNLLALASWRLYPFLGGAVIPVGLRCERLWLLLQSYVHPS